MIKLCLFPTFFNVGENVERAFYWQQQTERERERVVVHLDKEIFCFVCCFEIRDFFFFLQLISLPIFLLPQLSRVEIVWKIKILMSLISHCEWHKRSVFSSYSAPEGGAQNRQNGNQWRGNKWCYQFHSYLSTTRRLYSKNKTREPQSKSAYVISFFRYLSFTDFRA